VATSGQIWSLPGGQDSVNGLKDFSESRLMRLGQHRPQADVPWSHIGRVNPSDNWWAFLSAHCSFRRADLDGVGGWDESYTGWGVEDNDLGYRANKRGFAFIYAEDLKGFHIDHAMTRDEYLAKCTSALRNLRQFSSKFPEVAQDTRVKSRLEELELIVAGHAAKRDRQETAGGGAITDSPSV